MKAKNFAVVALTLVLLAFYGPVHAGVCEYADRAYAKVAAGVVGAGVAVGTSLKIAGVASVAHSSGAAIVTTASGGYLAGTLGAVGAVTGVITAPATLLVGGVAAAAAGGTLAYCHYAK